MNAVIYSRVSTEDQDNERQISELREYAIFKKMKVVKVFEEKVSGATKGADRLEFTAMKNYIAKNKVDTILVWELSRLGRKMVDVMNTIEDFTELGISIYIKKEGINTLDANGKKDAITSILLSVVSGFAEIERNTIRQRSISGIRHNVLNGGAGTGVLKPYGYQSVNKKLVIDQKEAETVKLIYKKYLSGLGTQQLAAYLNDLKIPTRFNKVFKEKVVRSKYGYEKTGNDYTWKDGTIYAILTNTIYIGERKHKGEVFKIEPIIEADLFEKVQIRLKQKYNKTDANIKHFNLLRGGLAVCGVCGKNYYLHERSNGNDKAYKCISKRYNEYCGAPAVGKDKLITALYIISSPLMLNDSIDEKIKSKDTFREALENKEIEVKKYKKDIEDLNNNINELIRMKLKKEINNKQFTEFKVDLDKDLAKKSEALNKCQSDLQKILALQKNKSKNNDVEYNQNLFKEFIRSYIEYVKIFPVVNKEIIGHFKAPQEMPILIEVKPTLSDNKIHFIISRRTNALMFVKMLDKNEDSSRQIKEGKYRIGMIGKTKSFVTMNEMISFQL